MSSGETFGADFFRVLRNEIYVRVPSLLKKVVTNFTIRGLASKKKGSEKVVGDYLSHNTSNQ